MSAAWRSPTAKVSPIPGAHLGRRQKLDSGLAGIAIIVIATMVPTFAPAAYLAAQNPPAGTQSPAAGGQSPAGAPQNPATGQAAGSAPKSAVGANPQPAAPLTPGSSTPAPPGAPTGTTTGARTGAPPQPAKRLRVEWRNGSLYVVAQRERLSTVLGEIARRTGLKVEGADQLHELVSVELTKMSLEDSLERLLARDDYAIQRDAKPDGSVRLRLVILRGAPDGSGLTASDSAAAPAAPPPGGQPAVPVAVSAQAPGAIPGNANGSGPPEDDVPLKRLQKLQQLAKSDKDDRIVLPALAKALDDDDDGVRDFAIQSLAARATPEAIGYLRDALHDPDPSTRLALIESLGEREEGRPILEEALSDADDSVRSEASALLKQIDASGPK